MSDDNAKLDHLIETARAAGAETSRLMLRTHSYPRYQGVIGRAFTEEEARALVEDWRRRNPEIAKEWLQGKFVKASWRARRLGWVRSAAYWLSERLSAFAEWLEY